MSVDLGGAILHLGDCLAVLRGMPDASADSVVTDPPYGLSFMGKKWDYDVPGTDVWAECLRVLKPGGHLLAFAGTRTQHRMAVRIEDAGFEIRDMIAWVYGCLDEATEVATVRGVLPYHKTKVGDLVLCYSAANAEYSYQPILEVVEYDYCDTAYRLVGDFGEQVVSRNHRVLVERGGNEVFQLAETLEREARVPVLESLPALRRALHDAHQRTGGPQQGVRTALCEGANQYGELGGEAFGSAQGRDDQVRRLRGCRVETSCVASQSFCADLQPGVQRGASRCGMGETRALGSGALVGRFRGGTEVADDGRVQPGVERGPDLPKSEGRVCGPADQVRSVPVADAADGSSGWVRHGAPVGSGGLPRPPADAGRVRPPRQPRCDGQPSREPDAVRHECAAQGVRAWRGHRSAVVRVVPFHYTGKVWCLRVSTGAFVAVRGGVAFPTGNSGFPKSLDVSKALGAAAGAKREFTPVGNAVARMIPGADQNASGSWVKDNGREYQPGVSAPATDAARQWQGWGTALKPALEPITVARKPLIGTVAANVLAHGTGGLNIDGCRVATGDALGRWPANLIHDGSDEVLEAFPQAPGQLADASTSGTQRAGQNVYGAMKRGNEPSADSANAGNVGFKMKPGARRFDAGSAARFFYCAKASKTDRNEGLDGLPLIAKGALNMRSDAHAERNGNTPEARANHHPTVKPTDLMRYLCRLVTPPGGLVLDPFMGSGSTGKAAVLEGFRFVGIEREATYHEITLNRIGAALYPFWTRT